MKCLSCQRDTTTKDARLWDRRIVLCASCAELADKAKAELEAAHRRAEMQAMMFLDQHILRGALLTTAVAQLPGIGAELFPQAVRDNEEHGHGK